MFFIDEEHAKDRGILALKEVLMDEYGFDLKKVRNLTIRYPQILSKDKDFIREYFTFMESYGLTNIEAY